MPAASADEVPLAGGRTPVVRRGSVVHRKAGSWAPTVHLLLRHLETTGFAAAPTVIGTGFDDNGWETLSFIEGDVIHPRPWNDDGVVAIGTLLRRLHQATATFEAPSDAVWQPWFGRNLGTSERAYGHCDLGPWNTVARDGIPVAFIDWEVAGPVSPLVELAQACWLNAQLHDDDIAERIGLPSAERRARQVRLIADAYGLARRDRLPLVEAMIALAIHDAADQAVRAGVSPDTGDATSLWAITWRTRAAAWMLRNRSVLARALA